MHIKQVDREFVELSHRAGCSSILFSPDGISQAAMDALQKETTEQELQQLVTMLQSDGGPIPAHLGFCLFINPPGETWSGLVKTFAFYLKLHLSRLKPGTPKFRVYANWIRLEPYTPAYVHALDEGAIASDVELLPEDDGKLDATFYRHPRQGWLDPFLLQLFKLEHWLGGKIRGRRPSSQQGMKAGR